MRTHDRPRELENLPLIGILAFGALIALAVISAALEVWAGTLFFLLALFLGALGVVFYVGFYDGGSGPEARSGRTTERAGEAERHALSPRLGWALKIMAATTVVFVVLSVIAGLVMGNEGWRLGTFAVAGALAGIGIGLLIPAVIEDGRRNERTSS